MEKANSWVLITKQDEYFKSIHYSGPQKDDGTIAKKYLEDLNSRNVGTFKLRIWDLSSYESLHDIPKQIHDEIKMASRGYESVLRP